MHLDCEIRFNTDFMNIFDVSLLLIGSKEIIVCPPILEPLSSFSVFVPILPCKWSMVCVVICFLINLLHSSNYFIFLSEY